MANNSKLASDSFGTGSLDAAWIAAFGDLKCQVVSHQAEANAINAAAEQFWQGGVFPGDQSSEITIGTGWVNESGSIVVIQVRASGTSSGAKICYEVDLANNTASLFVITNGSAVQQGSTISGLTIAAGDVWTLQVAGSVISLYQNNTFVAYFTDGTITTGAPGFGCFSSVNVAHAPVASWRGYSCVQQDGVWQKQGVMIHPNPTDLATLAAQNPTILLDSNPTLVSGSKVYKMWFSAGLHNVGYAESLDGLNWTRRGSDVLALSGFAGDPAILKIGSTYYLFLTDYGVLPTKVYRYTSSDGINWSSGTQVLSGGSSAWDEYLIFFTPVYVDSGGTWHAIYTGSASNTGSASFSTGYTTSPDGLTWTKYPGNPVVANFFGLEGLFNVGSTWYGWGAASNPGRGGTDPFDVPGDGIRMQTTDFIHWTNPVKSFHFGQMFEGLNTIVGGCWPTGQVLEIGGKTYVYTTSSVNDTVGSHNQISVAIAPVLVAALVQFPEDALEQIAADSFSGGAGDLSGNWTTPTGLTKLKVVAGDLCEASAASAVCAMCYTGAAFSNDQYSRTTLATLATFNEDAVPIVRAQLSGENFYFANIQGGTGSVVATVGIYKSISGVNTRIGPLTQATWEDGDEITLVASGSSPVLLSLYQNGFLILQVEDWSNAFLSGAPGIFQFVVATLANSQISEWSGGNAGVIPNYPPPVPPTPPGSIRLQIMDALEAALNASGVEKPDSLTVHRERTRPIEQDSLPAIMFYADDDVPKPLAQQVYRSPLTERQLTLAVECRAQGTSILSPDEALDPVLVWAAAAVASDETFGGLASGVEEGRTVWASREGDVPIAAAKWTITIKYRTSRLDPTSKS